MEVNKQQLLELKKDLCFNCYNFSLVVEKITDILTALRSNDKNNYIYNSYQYITAFKALLDVNVSFTKLLFILDMDSEDNNK